MRSMHIVLANENGESVIRKVTDHCSTEELLKNLKEFKITDEGVAVKRDLRTKTMEIIYSENQERCVFEWIMKFLRT